MQRVFTVFGDALGVVKLFFERADDDAVMLVYHQSAHFSQRLIKAVFVENAAFVFQHGEFRIALADFCNEIAPPQAQVFFRNPGLLRLVVIQFVLFELLHFFN